MTNERNRRVFFISGVGVIQRIGQLLSTLITFPLVLGALGVDGFGVWGAATSLAWLSGFLNLGIGSALVNLIPNAVASGRQQQIRDYVTAALACSLVMAGIVLAVGALYLRHHRVAALDLPFIAAGCLLVLNIPVIISRDIWYGLQKGFMAGYWEIFQTVLTVCVLVVMSLSRAGVTLLVVAVYGAMLIANSASLVHAMVSTPILRPRARANWSSIREVMGQGSMMFFISIAASCAYSLDNFLALHWLGPGASAQMVIAMRVCTTAIGLLHVMTLPLWPAFVESVALDDRRWIRRTLRDGTLLLGTLAVIGAALIVAFGIPVLRWWLHGDLVISQSLLWVMALWLLSVSLPQTAALLLNAMLHLRVQLLIMSSAAVAGFGLKYYGQLRYGLAGILGATPVIWISVVTPAYIAVALRAVKNSPRLSG